MYQICNGEFYAFAPQPFTDNSHSMRKKPHQSPSTAVLA